MQFRRAVYVFSVAMLSQFAQAEPGNERFDDVKPINTHKPLDAQQIGALQGVVDFCSSVDSKDAEPIEKLVKSLMTGLSAQQIAKDELTTDYKNARQTVKTVLAEFPAGQTLAACHALVKSREPDRKPPRWEPREH